MLCNSVDIWHFAFPFLGKTSYNGRAVEHVGKTKTTEYLLLYASRNVVDMFCSSICAKCIQVMRHRERNRDFLCIASLVYRKMFVLFFLLLLIVVPGCTLNAKLHAWTQRAVLKSKRSLRQSSMPMNCETLHETKKKKKKKSNEMDD